MADQPSAARLRPVFRQGMPGLPAAVQQQNQAFYVGPGDFLDLPDQGGQSDDVDASQDRRYECGDLLSPGVRDDRQYLRHPAQIHDRGHLHQR